MTHANDAQAEFWNSDPGKNWVRFQPDLDALHQSVTDRLLELAAAQLGEVGLDIGCGAGGSALDLARQVGPEGEVTGVDISDVLLACAEERGRQAGLSQLRFMHHDAQDAELPPHSFDLAISRFGVMFFADPVAAFATIAKALRPGGRMVFAAWAGTAHNPWFRDTYEIAAAHLGAPDLGPDGTGPGPQAFADTARVLDILTQAGLQNPQVVTEDILLRHPGGLDPVMQTLPYIGPIPRVMREHNGTANDLRVILDRVHRHFQRYSRPDGVALPAKLHFYSCQAPK